MTGRITAYFFRYQLRDLVVLRAGLPTFMAVFFGWMVLKTDGARVNWGGPDGERLTRDIVNMFGTYVFIPLATFLGAARLVTDDRSNGYFRFLFSKPVSILRFYVQQWVGYGLAVMVITGLLALWLQANTTTVPVQELVAVVGLNWILVGGVGFLLTVVTNYDALLFVIIWTVSKVLHALKDAENTPMWPWLQQVTRLLVPTQKLAHVQAELLAGNPLPVPQTIHVVAYGLLTFVAGAIILRKTSFSR